MSADAFALRLPPHTVTSFPQGVAVEGAAEADVLIVRHASAFASAIAWGQSLGEPLHPEWDGYTWTDHTAMTRRGPRGEMWVSEMGPRGYERRPLDHPIYADKDVVLVHFDVDHERRQRAIDNDLSMAGIKYGWEEYLGDAIGTLTRAEFESTIANHVICSAHVTLAMMGLGFFPDMVPTAVMPVHWAMWVGAELPTS